MSAKPGQRSLSARDLEAILAVTSKLAAPFDLFTMLEEVVSAARQVLQAERGSVWLYEADADELLLRVATGVAPVRVPAGTGIAGACARERRVINVPDCYADPRFNPELDRRTGYRTRCMLALPLVDHNGVLVGVMQVLNKSDGVFDADDEALATALAAQCAVALQRVRMTEAAIEGEKMRRELEMARVVQMSTLPSQMPWLPGYEMHGLCQPAGLTGGDTFDLGNIGQGLLVVLGDATGHGMGPALSVTQMQAMLRMAFRMGADLETAFVQVNNQLADTLADDRFITAFIGLLDATTHRLRFQSGGQAPILHFRAADASFESHRPTSFPLAAMPLTTLRPSVTLEMAPGDILVLLSDGIYEYHDPDNEQFGEERVRQLVAAHRGESPEALSRILLEAVKAFARGAPQEDDMTIVLLKRERPPEPRESRMFPRRIEALAEIFAFTAAFFDRHDIGADARHAIDFTIEELFTNMVKYSPGGAPEIRLDVAADEGDVEAALTDYDVERFDVTGAPDAAVDLPIEQRKPGGLGLHLIRRLVDAIQYEYSNENRQSRITFRKARAGSGHAAVQGEGDASD